MKNLFLGLVIAVLLIIGFIIKGLIGLGIVVFLIGGTILQGLRKIPAEPPHKAVVTIFGKRKQFIKKTKIEVVEETDSGEEIKKTSEKKEEITQTITQTKDEGWRLFLFFPYWHGFILVNVTKKNQDLPIQIVRTPDMAELEIPVSLTWTPLAAHLVEYLNAGGENGVKTILEDIVRERLREWAIVGDEGPQNWEEAMKARVEAASILTKAIVGEELSPIPSDIPTTILLKFFDKPQKFPTPSEMEKFGIKLEEAKEKFTDFDALPEEQKDEILNWGRVKEKIDELSSEEKENLEKALKQRKAIINSIRQGNGMQEIPQLGIVLNRLNIGEMKPRGKLAEAAELKAEEIKKMEGDKIRIENVTKRIVELEKLGFSPEQALEILQTERGKVKKEIKESKLNISPETRTMIEKITLDLLPNLLKRGGNQNG